MAVELITKKIIEETLIQKPIQGKRQLEPFKSIAIEKKLPFSLIEDSKITETAAEIHKKEGDLWHCLEGEVEFICEGELVKPKIIDNAYGDEVVGNDIKNGKKFILKQGDWLWIPPGQPHMHKADKTARMIIIKIPKSN